MKDTELIEAMQRTKLEIAILTRRLEEYQADIIARLKDHPINGYYIADRLGHRQWCVDAPIIKFMLSGLDVMTLKTPAQVENAGIDASVLKPLTNRPIVGQYIARVK
jgi:hypothetical protein